MDCKSSCDLGCKRNFKFQNMNLAVTKDSEIGPFEAKGLFTVNFYLLSVPD